MRKFLSILFIALHALSIGAHNNRYVNLFLGSAGDHGQLPPGAAVPFGIISVCPDSAAHMNVLIDIVLMIIS